MKVFSKYLLKSITEKKGRTMLLLISIAISCALLVASLGAVKALMGTLSAQIKGNLGEYNVSISPSPSVELPLFNPVEKGSNNINKSFRAIDIGGYLQNSNEKEFSLIGTSISDLKDFDTNKILSKKDLEPFTGKKLIISKKISDSLKTKLGDTLKLNILGKEEDYKVAAIAANKGLFFQDKDKSFSLVTPEENLFSIYGVKNKYSMELVSVKTKNLDSWIKSFNVKNKDSKLIASKIYDEKSIEQQMGNIQMPLYFMLAIVLIMTSFIIYSSFKLIITERLSVIGVFLSQGATKAGIMLLLLIESLIYGILGGIIGDLMGVGLTYMIAYFANPLKEYGVKATTELYLPYFIVGFIFAIVLSLVSTLLPIISIRKLPVKDVILNTIGTANKISIKGFILGLGCIILSAVFHLFGPSINYKMAIPEIFMAFVGFILILPKVVDCFFYPLVRFLRNINGVSMLSINNVRTSRVLINNIRLIGVSVISIIMIISLASSITEVVDGAYKGMKFDVEINVNSNYKKDIDDIIRNNPKIENIIEMGQIFATLNDNSSKNLTLVYVDPEEYKSFENYTDFKDKNIELDALNKNDDGIIISKQISDRYNIKSGDSLCLTTDNKKETFKVISVFDAKMMYGGNYNLISLKSALKHFDIKYPNSYFITTKSSAIESKKALENQLKGLGVTIITKAEMNKENDKNNAQMTNVMGLFSYITMVIGAFGILGNVSISFLQRKRELAVISSVGLSKISRSLMLLLEGLFQALIGCFLSLISIFGINVCLEDIFKYLALNLSIKYPYKSLGAVVISAIMLMLLTSISTVFKSSKLSIVKELKYE